MNEYRPTMSGKIQDFREQYSSIQEYKEASAKTGNAFRNSLRARKNNSSFTTARPLNSIPDPSNKHSHESKHHITHDEFAAKRSLPSLIPRRNASSKVVGLPKRDSRPGQGLNRDPFPRRSASKSGGSSGPCGPGVTRPGNSGQSQQSSTY